ncbi:class I SAM-dependent methyltransferase [Nocardia puris]|uniref:class I SAM-dependent methyltransferase n=1 Tax=Nocardia puris TaxID=208602 RepID=UPI002B4B45B5|nr:class I SAM-dependent methyltransferase [Nocardia puris]
MRERDPSCRACGGRQLTRVLDLGAMPATDYFPRPGQPEAAPVPPLRMAVCRDCGLAQLESGGYEGREPESVEPRALRDQAVDAIAEVARAGLLTGRTVREFPSPHGGSWLGPLSAAGLEPVTTGPADVVVDCFGLMHEPDQPAAFARRAAATAPGGVLLLQYHSLRAILTGRQWNALRHGHFAYYSLPVLTRLLAGAGLSVTTAWRFPLYGGTVLLAAVHGAAEPDHRVRDLLADEAFCADPAAASDLQQAADDDRATLRRWLEDEKRCGNTVYAYGAASRAVALFAAACLDRTLLAGVADAAPAKQGRRMPGTDIPIIAPAELVAARPDRVLLTLADLLPEVSAALPALAGAWVVDPRRGPVPATPLPTPT